MKSVATVLALANLIPVGTCVGIPEGWIEKEIVHRINNSLPYSNDNPLDGDLKECSRGFCVHYYDNEIDEDSLTREIFCGI